METDISFFNSFKERLVNGKVPNNFGIRCYPVTNDFFTKFNTDSYSIENFRTLDELNKVDFASTQFYYNQKTYYGEYCCEYLTEPNSVYKTETINGAPYNTIVSQRYNYLSAQMNYRYTEVPDSNYYKAPSASICYGNVSYDQDTQKFFVHFLNHLDSSNSPNFIFGTNVVNDGTTIYMGYLPEKTTFVNEMATNGVSNYIYPISGSNFRGLVFADTSGNLINYMDFQEPIDFNGGCFVYKFPQVKKFVDASGNTTKWATFVSLE